MKSIYILTIAILMGGLEMAVAQDFTRVHPRESTGRVIDIKVDESGIGYAMTSCGNLMYTDNFGNDWNEKPADYTVIGLEIVPGTDGKKLVIFSSNRIYFSPDKGDTFEDITPAGAGLFNHIAILENGNIIIPSRSGAIFVTDDEGVNWMMITENVENIQPFTIDFVDNLNGWIASTKGDVMKTTDGGMSWTLVHSDDDTDFYFNMVFANENIGYRSISANKLFKTIDGGATWNLHHDGLSFFSKFLVLNDTTLFSYIGIIKSISHDGGLNWTQYEHDVSALFQTVSALNENELWRCGLNKSIEYSSDQGETWTDQTNSFKTNLFDVAFLDKNTGAAVGDTGMLLYTTDGGTNWNEIETGTVKNITGVGFTKSGDLLVIGASLGILKSSDLDTFEEKFREVNSQAKLYSAPDRSALFVHGQAWLVTSLDDGETWTPILEKPDRSMRSFSAVSDQVIFVGDSRGDVHRSTNGGQTWETSNVGSTNFIRSMYFVNDQLGYVNSSDSIRVTHDGGVTFTGINSTAPNGFKMIMENDTVGWITGSSSPGSNQGFVYTTFDGWKSYSRVYNSCQGLSAMSRNPETGDMWFAGNGGNIETTQEVTSSVLNVKRIETAVIRIYPNPSSGLIQIELPENFDSSSKVQVHTISGVLVGSYNQNKIRSAQIILNPGVYIVTATSDNVIALGKVIITQ